MVCGRIVAENTVGSGKDGTAHLAVPLVVFALAEDHDELAFDVAGAGEGVVAFAGPERVAVDVGSEVADGGADPWVERAAVGEVAAEAHACCADAACACWKGEQGVDGEGGVFVVCGDLLGNLPFVACVGTRAVVGEGFGAGEFVV